MQTQNTKYHPVQAWIAMVTATIASECVSIERFTEFREWDETAWTIQRSIEAAL